MSKEESMKLTPAFRSVYGAIILSVALPLADAASESIFPESVTPAGRFSDAPNWELGTIFNPAAPGSITAVRVFSLAEETGEHQVRIWRNADNALIAGPIPWTFGGEENWITLDIPDVPVLANQDYTISISTAADGWYPANAFFFVNAGSNGQHLSYSAGAGVFSETAGTRPTTSFNNTAYLRDIVFAPNLTGPTMKVKGNGADITNADLSPSTADDTQFGGINLNSAAREHTFTISNTGQANLDLSGNPKVAISGPNAADFTVTAQPASPVPPGGTAAFTIRFSPSGGGLRDALVTITNNTSAGAAYLFGIEGVGLASGNRLMGNASEGTFLRTINADSIYATRQQALRNMRITEIKAKVRELELAGSYQCAIYSDQDGSPQQLLGSTSQLSSPPSGWQTFALKQPVDVSAGNFYWLAIWSDASGARVYADNGGLSKHADYPYGDWPNPVALGTTDTFMLCLYAEGTPLGITGPEMDLEGKLIEIADGTSAPSPANGTDVGAATAKSGTREGRFTIYNVGQASLDLTGSPRIAISGPNAADFSVITQPPASIAPGASAAFSVRFAPSAVGLRQATLTIPHGDSPANPWDFAMQGLGLGGGAGIIGHDSDGSFARNIDDAQIHGNRFQAPVDMRITELRARVLELDGTFKCAVYSDTNGWADRLLRGSVDVVNATNGWNAFTLTSPLDLTGGNYYWLVIWADTAGARVQADPVGTAYFGIYAFMDVGGQWPDLINLTESTQFLDAPARTYCIYAEGTPIGTAPGPELDLRSKGKLIVSGDTSPSLLDGTDFGSLDVKSGTRDQTFTIQNPGDAPLVLGNPMVTVNGPQAGDFIVTAQPSSPIAPGASATFTLRFDPANRGFRQATVAIASNDGSENPYEFAVQGAGFSTGRETIWADTKIGKDVDFDGTYYELGTIFHSSIAGKITHLRVFSLTSERGDHTARIWRNSDETVIGGPYTWNYGGTTGWITFDIPDVDIEADTDYTVSISNGTSPKRNYPNLPDLANEGNNGQHLFYPANAGVFTTTRAGRPTQSFNHGDYLRDIVFVPAGTVLDLPDINVLGNNVSIVDGATTTTNLNGTDFGQAAAGTGTVDRTFTISNVGTAPLNLSGSTKIAVTGLQAKEFTVLAQPPSQIAPGANAVFTIRFAPAATGVRTATISIENDSDKNPFDFAISGTGSSPALPLKIIETKADLATGNLTLRWEGGGPQFQVEKGSSVSGPFQAIGAALSERTFTDAGAVKSAKQSFYRIHQL